MLTHQQTEFIKIADLGNRMGQFNLELYDGFLPIDEKSVTEMVSGAVCEIRNALTVRPDDTIRFSRVKQSSKYLENSNIKFDGFNEGRASLVELKREFPNLHNAVCLLHDYPTMINLSEMMGNFQYFLREVSSINEYAIFVSIAEKENVREFSKACCEYVLGNSEKPEFPEFYQKKKNSNLVDRADLLMITSKNLHASIAGSS